MTSSPFATPAAASSVPPMTVPLPPPPRSLTLKLWLFFILISVLGVLLASCLYSLGWLPLVSNGGKRAGGAPAEQVVTLRLPANEKLVDARWTSDDRLTYTSRVLDSGEPVPRHTSRMIALVDRTGKVLRKMLVIEGMEVVPTGTPPPLPESSASPAADGGPGGEGEGRPSDASGYTFTHPGRHPFEQLGAFTAHRR